MAGYNNSDLRLDIIIVDVIYRRVYANMHIYVYDICKFTYVHTLDFAIS